MLRQSLFLLTAPHPPWALCGGPSENKNKKSNGYWSHYIGAFSAPSNLPYTGDTNVPPLGMLWWRGLKCPLPLFYQMMMNKMRTNMRGNGFTNIEIRMDFKLMRFPTEAMWGLLHQETQERLYFTHWHFSLSSTGWSYATNDPNTVTRQWILSSWAHLMTSILLENNAVRASLGGSILAVLTLPDAIGLDLSNKESMNATKIFKNWRISCSKSMKNRPWCYP